MYAHILKERKKKSYKLFLAEYFSLTASYKRWNSGEVKSNSCQNFKPAISQKPFSYNQSNSPKICIFYQLSNEHALKQVDGVVEKKN